MRFPSSKNQDQLSKATHQIYQGIAEIARKEIRQMTDL
jgi:hypothetical protein